MGNRQSKLFQNTPVNTECNPYPSIHPPVPNLPNNPEHARLSKISFVIRSCF